MTWHGYMGIENLALNASQKADLITALRALGNQTGDQPNLISQFRARLDNEAAIFEAVFADDDLTIPAVKQYLAGHGLDVRTHVQSGAWVTSITLRPPGASWTAAQVAHLNDLPPGLRSPSKAGAVGASRPSNESLCDFVARE